MDHHEFWLLVPLSIAIWKHLSIVRIQSHGHIPEADAYQRCKQIKQGKFPIYIGMTPQALYNGCHTIYPYDLLIGSLSSIINRSTCIYKTYIYSFIAYNSYDIIYIYIYNMFLQHHHISSWLLYIMSRFPSSLVIQFPGWYPPNSNFRPASLVPFASKALHR